MTEGHLKYFKIKNFKRFDELELDGLGQFNLITGDNNVGKTSLLESLLARGMEVWYSSETFWVLHRTLDLRGLNINVEVEQNRDGQVTSIYFPETNYLSFLQKDITKHTEFFMHKSDDANFWFHSFDREELVRKIGKGDVLAEVIIKAPPTARYFVQYTNFINNDNTNYCSWLHFEELNIGPTNKRDEDLDLPFVPVSQGNTVSLLVLLYHKANPQSSKTVDAELAEYMRVLIPEIDVLTTGPLPGLYIGLRGIDERVPLHQFGDGVVRLTRLLFHIFSMNEGERLMIDEIDTGIHYSRMKSCLQCLVRLAEKKGVQLFMTTHSLECQEAFAEVFEDPEMVHLQSEFRNITLVEALDHSVKPFIYTHQQLAENLELGIETRGRKLA